MTAFRPPPRATLVQLLVCIALAAFILALTLPAVRRAREAANLARCKDNLRQIGVSLRAYASWGGGAFPVSPTIENPQAQLLRALEARGLLPQPASFYCPSESRRDLQYSAGRFHAGTIDYFYYSAMSIGPDQTLSKFLRSDLAWPRMLNRSMDARTWLMSDRWTSGVETNHAGYRKGVNYLTADGSVSFLSESPRRTFR